MLQRTALLAVCCLAVSTAGSAPRTPNCKLTVQQQPSAFAQQYRSHFADELAAVDYWAQCRHRASVSQMGGYKRVREHALGVHALQRQVLDARLALAALAGEDVSHAGPAARVQLELHFAKLGELMTSRAGQARDDTTRAEHAHASETAAAALRELREARGVPEASRAEYAARYAQLVTLSDELRAKFSTPDAVGNEVHRFLAYALATAAPQSKR